MVAVKRLTLRQANLIAFAKEVADRVAQAETAQQLSDVGDLMVTMSEHCKALATTLAMVESC